MTIRPAIVLAAHGERGGAFSNAVLLGHAERVRQAFPGHHVGAGVLSGVPSLEEALATAAATGGPIFVYPFFMAAGFFVTVRIPEQMARLGLVDRTRILRPLSDADGLAAFVRTRALAAARAQGIDPARARLILVGHGSKVARASAVATTMAAARLRELGGFEKVVTAFLEEPPLLGDVVGAEAGPTIVVGFFNGDGLHARDDVPRAMAGYAGPIAYTGAIGAMPEVAGLIVAEVERVLADHARG